MGDPDVASDAAHLRALADRLESHQQDGCVAAAAAARHAAARLERDGPDSAAALAAALRRRALDLAVRLDLLGHPADAGAVCGEVARRAAPEPGAMADGPFRLWLDAIEAALPEGEGRAAVA